MTDGQLLMPAAQAARKMGISRQSLRRLIHQEAIRAVRIGNLQRVYIPQGEIDRIIKPSTANVNLSDHSQPFPTVTDSPQSIVAIMAMPIHFEERWKLLQHASPFPRNNEFFNAIMALVAEADSEREVWKAPGG